MELVKRNGTPSPLPDLTPTADIATLTLTLRADGSIQIVGPVQNKMLCYGLMESAKMTIAALPTSPIIPV